MQCTACGTANAEGSRFCSRCGKSFVPMVADQPTCVHCHYPLLPNARFCAHCGQPSHVPPTFPFAESDTERPRANPIRKKKPVPLTPSDTAPMPPLPDQALTRTAASGTSGRLLVLLGLMTVMVLSIAAYLWIRQDTRQAATSAVIAETQSIPPKMLPLQSVAPEASMPASSAEFDPPSSSPEQTRSEAAAPSSAPEHAAPRAGRRQTATPGEPIHPPAKSHSLAKSDAQDLDDGSDSATASSTSMDESSQPPASENVASGNTSETGQQLDELLRPDRPRRGPRSHTNKSYQLSVPLPAIASPDSAMRTQLAQVGILAIERDMSVEVRGPANMKSQVIALLRVPAEQVFYTARDQDNVVFLVRGHP